MVLVERLRILIAEDNAIAALDLGNMVEQRGFLVLGPVSSVADALGSIRADRPDAALLDINLRGESIWPVAELLDSLDIPFVLTTGYDNHATPQHFVNRMRLLKPLSADGVGAALEQMRAKKSAAG